MKEITINQINQGGISDSKYMGESNSVASSVGLDLHSIPGVIQSNYKLTKESGTTIDEFCKVIVPSSEGNTYFFSSTSGKIWVRSAAGAYSLKYTTVPTGGSAACLGALEFDGYIYWASERYLYRVPVNSSGWDSLPDGAVEWAVFTSQDNAYHPMIAFGNNLWIGDGHLVCNVFNNTFTANALDLPDEQRIRALGKLDIQLAMGTYVNNYVNKSTIFRWDTWSVSWNMDDTVEELGVNAFIPIDNYFYVAVGQEGNIYAYDNNMLYLVKRIPGDYSTTKTSVVFPNATAYFKGKPLFGVSNGSTASGATPGIYGLATVNPRLYNRVLTLEYVPSTTSDTLEIGAMAVQGNNLFVSWKSGTSVGIDNIDYTTRYATSYLESRVIHLDRGESNIYTKFVIGYVTMPTGCSVQAYVKQNYASSWTEIVLTKDVIRNRYASDIRLESNTLEFKVVLNSSGASSPLIDYISLMGNDSNE